MNSRQSVVVLLVLALASFTVTQVVQASTLDRNYKMGDDASEGAVANGAVSTTFDSQGEPGMNQLVDLTAVNSPVYREITGRPDGAGGKGIEFNAAQQSFLHGPSLGDPAVSYSSIGGSGTLNYTGIVNRGFQFWVRPTSTAVQSLVMDTNQHGARINEAGKFSMRYAGADYESTVAVSPNTWYHVMVVRPFGAANGSRMFVNGDVVAAVTGGYNDDTSHLVVGANTAGEEDNFTGGTSEFFSGIIDDLKMFVMGVSDAPDSVDWGVFNVATDNDFIADVLTGVAGDLTNDGVLNQADKNAFIAGWLDERIVGGVRVADLASYKQGDINFDGITDIADLAIFQGALSGAGIGAITAAELQGVPEPSTALLLLVAVFGSACISRRHSDQIRRK